MTTSRLFLALFLFFSGRMLAHGAEAAILAEQFKKDLLTLVSDKAPKSSVEQRATFADSAFVEVGREFPGATSATPAQLETLRAGQCPFSDEEVRRGYDDLKTLADRKPMPDIVEFYKGRFDAGHLNPVQKTVYFNLTSAIRARIRANK